MGNAIVVKVFFKHLLVVKCLALLLIFSLLSLLLLLYQHPAPVPSVYEWEGKVNEDPEVLMMIKTRTSRIPELTEFVQSESYSPHQFSVSGTEVEIVTKISTYVVAQPNREEFSLELCSPQLHTSPALIAATIVMPLPQSTTHTTCRK